MSGLEELVPLIYHEKQQSGSMLCAQHALNSLLQGPYFTPPDLSEIARKLDVLEEQYNTESERGDSKNMDDTGFFSVQVIEEAIKVWGLNLVRWRSNAMRPYQDHPHTQLAFILNLEQHWFSLRRFGPASANIDEDTGQGHWFNLNSFLQTPEWVGRLYLGMVLQQAEAEGYSVFAVVQADPSEPLALPRTETDDIAATLPEPQSASRSSLRNATKHDPDPYASPNQASGSESRTPLTENLGGVEGVEDEDYELQAALQASLASQEGYVSPLYDFRPSDPPVIPPSHMNAASPSMITTSSQSSQGSNLTGHADLDPVIASMERNRVLLQRMREQQEYAQRELWSANGLTPEEQAAREARQQERMRREEEEEEELRKAIAESEAMARERDEHQQHPKSTEYSPVHDDVDAPSTSSGHFGQEHRNYDDEDAELQAALKASLENVPSGWQHLKPSPPVVPKRPEPPVCTRKEIHDSSDLAMVENHKKSAQDGMDIDDDEWESESEASNNFNNDVSASKESAPALEGQSAPLSLDEIRKARLARFGF